jgi:tetratricopeptide (TPR) repeat protein
MELRRVIPVCLLWFFIPGLPAQDFGGVADQYVRWAEEAIRAGRWNEALAGLERGADYADLSSDLSYLLALARSHTGKPRGAVLEALRRAGDARRWNRYAPEAALLLEAETLIILRNFSGALNILARLPEDADSAALRLRALRGLPDIREFRRVMEESLERYPRDPRPALIFFEYARGKTPEGTDQALMDLILRRLPYMVEAEPRLAYLAAPFIRDRETARRLLGACRELSGPLPASIPASLGLGLIDGAAAVDELFAPPVSETGASGEWSLDRDLIQRIFNLLADEDSRTLLRRRLFRFSGIITADADQDGVSEGRARYQEGVIGEYSWDADQDGLAELRIFFDAGGVPQWAEHVVLPESPEPAALAAVLPAAGEDRGNIPAAGEFAFPVRDEDRTKALIRWERYPGVQQVELEGRTYIPPPGDFLFRPIRFIFLAEEGSEPGLLYPLIEPLDIRISRRTLAAFSKTLRRPSGEFEGAVEWIELGAGIPLKAVEILESRPVSVTEFIRGRPVTQRVDLDLDGRMETFRHFQDQEPEGGAEGLSDYKKIIRLSESDWDGDGIFETGELYLSDGTVVYSWDIDGDGIREYSETKAKE